MLDIASHFFLATFCVASASAAIEGSSRRVWRTAGSHATQQNKSRCIVLTHTWPCWDESSKRRSLRRLMTSNLFETMTALLSLRRRWWRGALYERIKSLYFYTFSSLLLLDSVSTASAKQFRKKKRFHSSIFLIDCWRSFSLWKCRQGAKRRRRRRKK